MNKKAKRTTLLVLILILVCVFYYKHNLHKQYAPTNDEFALKIKLDTKEDIGLLVFDYEVDGHTYSGGISNADKSSLQKGSTEIQIWNKQELQTTKDQVDLSIQFRIITDYVDPNFENNYPKELTKRIETPIHFSAQFGKIYTIIITGDKQTGYQAILKNN